MSVNPISFRMPFETQLASMPSETQYVIRNVWNCITDLQSAVPVLKNQIDAVKSSAATTATTVASNASTPTQTIIQNISPTLGYLNNQVGQASYQTKQSDNGGFVLLNNSSPIAVTLAQTFSMPGIVLPWYCTIINEGTSPATLTPVSGTINGAASFSLTGGRATTVVFDGSNFFAIPLVIVPVNTPPVAHEWLASYDSTTGAFTQTQPAFTDISGVASPSQLPTPTASTIGGVESIGPVTSRWIYEIDTFGIPHLSQPSFVDLSGTATAAQVPALSALSGQITTAQLPAAGLSATITTAKLTTGGTQGSMTFTNGVLTAQVQAT